MLWLLNAMLLVAHLSTWTVTWYADPFNGRDTFHGKPTASGRVMDGTSSLGFGTSIAAHKSLPFGSLVCLIYNKKIHIVQIEDRGALPDADLDIPWYAAYSLGLLDGGKDKDQMLVNIMRVGYKTPYPEKNYRQLCLSFLKKEIKKERDE